MLFPPPLPTFPHNDQPPAKAPRHYLPFSLSEWDIRLRKKNADSVDDNKENCCWNMTNVSRREIMISKRSRSLISADRCWAKAKATEAAATEVPTINPHEKRPSGGDEQQTEPTDNVTDHDDDGTDHAVDDALSHNTVGHSSFYIKFCNSLTLRRSYERQRRPPTAGGSSASATEAGGGEKADDATSLDTWLSRRRHRRRDGFNLTPAAWEENGNSRFGRLVSCSFGKLREMFSMSSRCGNGTKQTAEEERKNMTTSPEGTFDFEEEEAQKERTTTPEGAQKSANAKGNVRRQMGEHCQWLLSPIVPIECGGQKQQQRPWQKK